MKSKLRYILIKPSNPNKQDDVLYKTSFNQLIHTLWSDNFVNIKSRDKLYDLVLKGSVFSSKK